MKLKYIGRRLLICIPTFLGITVLSYFMSALAPGSPLDRLFMSTGEVSQEMIDLLTVKYGLDQPVYLQYFSWMKELLQGNFGTSYRTGEPVFTMITDRIGPTLLITVTALLLALLIAIPVGILAAVKANSVFDYVATGLSMLAMSAPNFFIGMIFVYFFSVQLGWLPTGGMYTTLSNKTLGDLVIHMIMPSLVLSFQEVGNYIRQVRGSMIEVLREDYIRTAREKGLTSMQTVIRHALRNSLIPLLTLIGTNIPVLIGGAVVTEGIFSWPGIGTLMIQSVEARDYPCIMGITVFIAVVVMAGNLVIDLLYGFVDPRISYDVKRGKKDE